MSVVLCTVDRVTVDREPESVRSTVNRQRFTL